MSSSSLKRFSSRRQPLSESFLNQRLKNAQSYDRIAGYFSSSLLEVAGESLESINGSIRIICNSDLQPDDVITARAAKSAIWQSWTRGKPEDLLDDIQTVPTQKRFQRLYDFLVSGKLEVRVLPNEAFGLIHGKAGVITLADGSKTAFMGSANESIRGWRLNYELIWEDNSDESVAWVQEEFDALWGHAQSQPLSEAVIKDINRLSHRTVIHNLEEYEDEKFDPAAAVIETPVYRQQVGLWPHQKYFVKLVNEAHTSKWGQARFVLADQVGLGKTLQLAMAAELIALQGKNPILVICPKTLVWQWQTEMRDMLGVPSAVWDGKRWIDERGEPYPEMGPEGIRKCPRRIGIVSGGLISYGSDAVNELLRLKYDCIILDEAHRARRRNLGEKKDNEAPEPNNLLKFMYQLAERTRSLLLATATPVQLRPIEAWDLLDVLSRGDESVLGNQFSKWRSGIEGLNIIMGKADIPARIENQWEWIRNPFPPAREHRDFEVLRRSIQLPEDVFVIQGDRLSDLSSPDRQRLSSAARQLFSDHHPFIRRIVRRTRKQLEETIDPETNEPMLTPIAVELMGDAKEDAIPLTTYLREAYEIAEDFCQTFEKGSGFIKTLLLRRVGSSIHAGLKTAKRMLGEDEFDVDEDDDLEENDHLTLPPSRIAQQLDGHQRLLLEKFIAALEENKQEDPKYRVVEDLIIKQNWLDKGCIVFSQYRDSVLWLSERLTERLPNEPIGIYSGPSSSGVVLNGEWTPIKREIIKERVRTGKIRLLLGTDAASEGLNLQKLGTLINLDLPWNPTKLEQRKGRIQRIGQVHNPVFVYNLRYRDSVEDRVHELLSSRLKNIHNLFGQIPDVLEDAWISVALGEQEQAKKIIDAVPEQHAFDLRYTQVESVDWESTTVVLSEIEKRKILVKGW